MDYQLLAQLPREKQELVIEAYAKLKSFKRNRPRKLTRFERIVIFVRETVKF